MLMTESVDNFISDSLQDFVDARYRAVSLADLFPDGYRRFLANNLTGDTFIKAPRVAADTNGKVLTDSDGFPEYGIGWTTWWTPEVKSCFPGAQSLVCSSFGADDEQYGETKVKNAVPLDPQVDWEQQKFFIAWTLMYLPENQQQDWLNMMRIWELGQDSDPGITNRIEFHDPSGKVYVAQTYGRETIFGKSVERGIAARILEYANELLTNAYETTDGPDLDGDGLADWFLPRFSEATGKPIVKFDNMIVFSSTGSGSASGQTGCNASDDSECTCNANRYCVKLQKYIEVPFFMRQALSAYGLATPTPKGIYD